MTMHSRKATKWLAILALAASLVFGAAIAQDASDATLERGSFAAVDADGDGSLTIGAFGTGLFDMVAGGELVLGQERFETFLEAFSALDLQVTFAGLDVNGDNVLTANQEFTPGAAVPVFEAWDTNGNDALSEQEYREGWFATMDADGDGYVTEAEYAAFQPWFGAPFSALGDADANGIALAGFMTSD